MVTMDQVRDGRTQACVARMFNMSMTQYRNYELGRTRIPADFFLRFCKRFSVDPYEVMVPGEKYENQ